MKRENAYRMKHLRGPVTRLPTSFPEDAHTKDRNRLPIGLHTIGHGQRRKELQPPPSRSRLAQVRGILLKLLIDLMARRGDRLAQGGVCFCPGSRQLVQGRLEPLDM